MLILGLDTASEQGSIALAQDESPVSEIVFPAALKQGEKLLPMVDAILKFEDVKLSDLELLAVSMGPGSFTGLRIGIATAKGLARALQIPVVGVPSCDAYARAVDFWEGPVWVLLPDRRDWVYYAGYEKHQQVVPVQAASLEDFLKATEEIGAGGHPQALFVGPAVERYRERLVVQRKRSVMASAPLNRPSGLEIAWLGWEKYRQSRRNELQELEPFYLASPVSSLHRG